MVSHRLCQRMTERVREHSRRLVVIGDEGRPAYDRVNLTRILFGDAPETLELAPRSWYEHRGIELITGDRVIDVDVRGHRVRTAVGRVIDYDELVFATGSRPRIPSLRGVEHPGVFVYRSVEDLASIRVAALRGRRAVVLGGGVLGLEAARALADLGLATTVVEAGSALLGRQLPPESAAELCARIEAGGIAVRLETVAVAITVAPEDAAEASSEGLLRVALTDGAEVETDLVVIAAGVTPRDELAREAGITCLRRGGIVVDQTLETSVPGVYAIGECAAFEERCLGFVAPGFAMADALAERLLGHDTRYRVGLSRCDLKGAGVEAAAIGMAPDGCALHVYRDQDGIRTLAVHEGRLVAATSVGPWAGLGQARDAIASEQKVSARTLDRFKRTGELPGHLRLPVASWPPDRLVCNCVRVSRGQLSAAMTHGATGVAALMQATGAGALCGSCEPLLDELCGGESVPSKRGRWVLVSSLLALTLVGLVIGLRPIAFADSIQASGREVDRLWREGWIKQTTGFGLLSLGLFAASIAVRKRWAKFTWGRFSRHRSFHTTVGALAILMTVAHTGLRMGHNLNFALMTLFVVLSLLGAATGIIAHLEGGVGSTATMARWWRPWVARAHWVATWPLAVLLSFHILTVYYY